MADEKGDTQAPPKPAAPPIIAQIKNEELSARMRMERSVSQEIREERDDLKEAAEHTSNVIVDVGLDGVVRWASPSWSNVVGTAVEDIQGKPIKELVLEDQDDDPFADAVKSMKEDDSKSQIIHFRTKLGPNSLFKKSDVPKHAKEVGEVTSPEPDAEEKKSEDGEDAENTILLEGQGIMVYDRSTGEQSHTMWMLRPAVEPREITIDLPDVLVDSLGFGAEVLATYLTALADVGAEDPAHHPPPSPILCRICERQITPWWFEKHSDLCLQENKAESEVQQAHEALMEQRKAIEKVLDSLSAPRLPRSAEPSGSPAPPIVEYKGLPISAPSASSSSSASGRASPATPPRSRESSVSSSSQARAKSFTVRRPVRHIVELLIDLCDTAIEIKIPALISDEEKHFDGEFRTLTPTSETRVSQVLNFSTPTNNILETEQGLALLASDTENLAREKVEATTRHQRILEYTERIRIEFHVLVQDCIEAAIRKANNLREGRDSDESEEEEEEAEDEVETPAAGTSFISETPEPESSQENSQQSSTDAALAGIANLSLDNVTDRRRSVAISTGSNSPMECPTPRSSFISGSVLGRSQSIGKRSSLYAASDTGDSDGSLSSSVLGQRTDSPGDGAALSRSRSCRDPNKRRSLKLPAVSASPHRQPSPGRAPASPLRLAKDRIPSGAYAASSPIGSPMISSMEPSSPADHRRQSSILSSSHNPPSPRLSAVNQQPKSVPPSIKDFEIIKPISKGAFGSVYLSKKKATGDYYAIKVLKKSDMIAKNQITNIKAERAIMMWQGESDFVAKLYWTFSSKDFLYLVMEYLNGGDCASLIKVLGGLPESWAKKYLAEVILGVEHLHERGIVHRDLKPDNLLIDQKGHLKLTDFGLSRMGLVGRQKRLAKSPSPNDSVPDLLKQGGPFTRPLSMTSSRSASFDFPSQNSPGATPLMTPDLDNPNGQPTYFNIGRDPIFGPHHSRRASGYRSDSGSSGTFGSMFKNMSLDEPTPRGPPIEEESFGDGLYSPEVFPLSLTTSHTQGGTPPQQSGISAPPPMALYDPGDQNRRFVGTPDYLAPETINGDGLDASADWWSCGCILFEFLCGYPPFHAETPEKVFENILSRNIEWPSEDECSLSKEARDLMDRLMTTDVKKRLGSNASDQFKSGGEEIRKHPWFIDINWDTIFEDEAQFVPAPENPEDTEYFDPRGATLQAFAEEFEEQSTSPATAPNSANDYQERPHDALSGLRRQVNQSIKRTLMPLHIPAHVRDSRSRRLSEPVATDDFGSFTFKNLPVLEKANKDVIQKLRAEAMKESGKKPAGEPTSGNNSPAPSGEGSPLLPSPLKRTLSTTQRGAKPPLPSSLGPASASPHRLSQPTSPLLVQFSTGGNHERRKTSGGSSGTQSQSSIASSVPALPSALSMPATTPSPVKSSRASDIPPMHSPNAIFGSTAARGAASRARSHTVGSQDNSGLSPKPFRDHKRRSQVFDVSPSSSDNEDPRAKALLRVQRRRQSSRRMSQFSLADGPCFRPLDVLICEDHPVSRMVMERLLEKIRCRTITAVTGPEAVRFATSEVQFDIIMMEIKLPQLNGSDVARMIRTTKNANQTTPIVAVTGYLKELPTTHNFDSLIEKPPTIEKLTEVLCQLCQWKAPPPDWHPGPQQHGPSSLRQEALLNEDSPSSQSSGPFGPNPGASYRASSREDSIGSSSLFGDMEPADAVHAGVIISSGGDDWGTNPLGISEDPTDPRSGGFHHPGLPHLIPFNSAPPVLDITLPSPRKEPSSEAIKARKAAHAKRSGEGGESGDDEDDELGGSVLAPPAPTGPTTPKSARHRARSSKLSTQMLRTNSRGSVISADEASPSATEVGGVGLGIAEQMGPAPTSVSSRPSTSGSMTGETKLQRPQPTPLPQLPPPSVSPPTTAFPGLGEPPERFPPESSGEQVKEIIDLDATPRPSLSVLPPEAMLFDGSSVSTPRPLPTNSATTATAASATTTTPASSSSTSTSTPTPTPGLSTQAAIAAAAAAAASTSPTPGAVAAVRERQASASEST